MAIVTARIQPDSPRYPDWLRVGCPLHDTPARAARLQGGCEPEAMEVAS